MITLFLGLTLANLAGLVTAIVFGYLAASNASLRQWHTLVGALATILCVAVHCVVFTYFIATAKWVQHAISLKQLDPTLASPTRSFKAQAFPWALGAIFTVFFTAIFGAAADNHLLQPLWHHFTALFMLAVNLFAAVGEYAAIRKNGQLIDRVLELANRT